MKQRIIIALVVGICCPIMAHSEPDPAISRAKAAILKAMRDPGSARFTSVRIRSAADGSKGVCGEVSGKNAFGGTTGPRLFVYDGKIGRVLVADAGAENPTKFDAFMLGVMLGENLKIYEAFCK